MLGLLPFLMVIGNSMFIPLLPTMEVDMGISTFQSGLILTVFSIPAALSIPFVGILADRIGRKRVVMTSLIVIALGSLVCAGATFLNGELAYSILLVGRFVQGLGAGGTASLAMTFIGDRFYGEKRSVALGTMEVFNGLGKAISPILGALAALLIWTSTFWVYFLLATLALIGISKFIHEVEEDKITVNMTDYIKGVFLAMKKEAWWITPVMFAGGVALFLLFGLLVYLSYEVERVYGMGGITKGLIIAIPLTVFTMASFYAGKKVGQESEKVTSLLVVSLALCMLPISFALIYHSFIATVIYLTLIGAGVGFFLPCCNFLVTSAVSHHERGMVVSFYHMIRFLGVAFGPVVYSSWMMNEWGMFLKSFVLLGVVAVWLKGTFPTKRLVLQKG